ncbi:heme/hemin ABC transporter substrate-binding protein [Dietzia sp.]|uniref:heme/hemin ABC transporter substrate-binding protein n=1 Tax=Dietzia sp. TaxID=1871616 RepID=UPI002FDA55E3
MHVARGRPARRIRALAGAAASVALLAGCGIGAENPGAAASGTAVVEKLPSRAEVGPPAELRGLSTVAPVGDIEPVAEDPQASLPVSFTDASGTQVEVTDTSRILPLDLYDTLPRIVSGLGLGGNIIGRTVSSTEPSLAELPVVTQGGHELNVEAILELRPSVVLVDDTVGPPEAIEQIRSAGVTVAEIDPRRTPQSLEDDITLVAGALGVRPEGEKLGERTRAQMDAATTEIGDLAPEGDKRLRMVSLYMRGNGGVFFVLGKGSGADTVIESLGGVDVASEQGIVDTVPANAESLAELDPEVILVMSDGLDSTGGLEGLLARPGVAQTTAGKKQRVVALPDSEAVSMGPQAGISLVRFARAIYTGDDVA